MDIMYSNVDINVARDNAVLVPVSNMTSGNCMESTGNGGRTTFNTKDLNGFVQLNKCSNGNFVTAVVVGHFDSITNTKFSYMAANPIDRGYTYSGSGLPFPNEDIAYENTPNKGEGVIDNDGDFSLTLMYPNAYYINQGSILLNPHVELTTVAGEMFSIDLGRPFQNRSLKHLPDRYNRTIGR
jgi:hypothetical protein